MRLRELLEALDRSDLTVVGDAEVEVTRVDYDSRRVEPGSLFCCVPGFHLDGHDFASPAVEAGAVAILTEHELGVGVTQVIVPETRAALGHLAARFNGDPCRKMAVVGITGTNGKTTTAYMIDAVLRGSGRRSTVIGTLTGSRTTPEAPDLQARLAHLRDDGVGAVVMEVSSHALALHRVDGCWFQVGVFTNLSQDHLDFHGDIETYFEEKARLFVPELVGIAVVNGDDPYGMRIAERARVPTVLYHPSRVQDLEVGATGSGFTWRDERVILPIGGRFNVANALAAAETGVAMGLTPPEVARGLGTVDPVRGRFELVDEGQPFMTIVDYAHTPDGLAELLASAGELSTGRVTVVFGCGGDRDREKRPAMGEVASRMADSVILTSDNPRSEEPEDIIHDIMRGIERRGPVVVVADRGEAIATALGQAQDGDVVVIAGKGHETTQALRGEELPFDDRAVARAELRRLLGADR